MNTRTNVLLASALLATLVATAQHVTYDSVEIDDTTIGATGEYAVTITETNASPDTFTDFTFGPDIDAVRYGFEGVGDVLTISPGGVFTFYDHSGTVLLTVDSAFKDWKDSVLTNTTQSSGILLGSGTAADGTFSWVNEVNRTTHVGQHSVVLGEDISADGDFNIFVGQDLRGISSGGWNAMFGQGNDLYQRSPRWTFSAGHDNKIGGSHSAVFGRDNIVRLNYSAAFGLDNDVDGYYSFAAGAYADIISPMSVAFGYGSTAGYPNETGLPEVKGAAAFNLFTSAQGHASTAFGHATNADAFVSFALGRSNTGGGDKRYWIETDPLFQIGNGLDDNNRSNAMTMLKNGHTTITNKHWDGQNPLSVPTATDASAGDALVIEGHTLLKGRVILAEPQGDISMGAFGQ